MTDRDYFAAAALTGLLHHDAAIARDDTMARKAYELADAMLRVRDSRAADNPNHDAAPEATAVSDEARTYNAAPSHRRDRPGDTPVTEPMPKEKRAEVSDSEPVAWAAGDLANRMIEVHATKKSAENAKFEAAMGIACQEWDVFSLYRHPPCQDFFAKNLTLTDAEREAVEWRRKGIVVYAVGTVVVTIATAALFLSLLWFAK